MFKLGHIPNHTGKQVAEEPIRDLAIIAQIKQKLSNNPRDYCLFVFGINTACRAGDLLNIRIKDVRGKVAGDDVVIKEEKTGKIRRIVLNDCSAKALHKLRAIQPHYTDEDYLFQGQRGKLTVSYVNRLVKTWCRDAGLVGQYGSHTLRKTWASTQYHHFGVPLETLMIALNHSSPRQTLQYICISSEAMKQLYSNCI